MVKQGGGQIVNTISGIAILPMAAQSRYAATKAALNALTLALRSEYWDDNVKISSASPGLVATDIWEGNVPEAAQTPQQPARRILSGVAKNDRIIFADLDVSFVANSNNPSAQQEIDEYLLHVARERRKGKIGL